MKRSHSTSAKVVLVLIGFSWAAGAGFGQDLQKGEAEATAQAGVVAGIGTHGSFGASIGAAATDQVFVFGEFSYIPLGGGSVEAFGFRAGGSAKAYGFNFGGQYLFPKSGALAPYAGAVWGFCTTPSNIQAALEVPVRVYLPAEQTPISVWAAAPVTTVRIDGASNQKSCSL